MEKCSKCGTECKKLYKKKYYSGRFCWTCHKSLPFIPKGKKKQIEREIREKEAMWNNKAALRRYNQGHRV